MLWLELIPMRKFRHDRAALLCQAKHGNNEADRFIDHHGTHKGHVKLDTHVRFMEMGERIKYKNQLKASDKRDKAEKALARKQIEIDSKRAALASFRADFDRLLVAEPENKPAHDKKKAVLDMKTAELDKAQAKLDKKRNKLDHRPKLDKETTALHKKKAKLDLHKFAVDKKVAEAELKKITAADKKQADKDRKAKTAQSSDPYLDKAKTELSIQKTEADKKAYDNKATAAEKDAKQARKQLVQRIKKAEKEEDKKDRLDKIHFANPPHPIPHDRFEYSIFDKRDTGPSIHNDPATGSSILDDPASDAVTDEAGFATIPDKSTHTHVLDKRHHKKPKPYKPDALKYRMLDKTYNAVRMAKMFTKNAIRRRIEAKKSKARTAEAKRKAALLKGPPAAFHH